MQFFKNPFYIYAFSFLFIILIYMLRWSDLYPNLSLWLFIFILISSIISFVLGAIIDKYRPIRYKLIDKKIKSLTKTIILIYLLYTLEFINNKGIPLVLILNTDSYDYTNFGIKTLHPILTTFTSFYTVYVFHIILSKKTQKKTLIIYLILLLIIPILIYNRGMFLINLMSFLFVFLMSIKKIKTKIKFYLIISFITILYLFGVLGNYRMVGNSSNEYFLKVSKAKESFINSLIPKEFMWAYIYVSSPLGNLQNTIEKNPAINYRFKDFIFTETLPDFLSKRISILVNAKRVDKINRLTTFLTVGTVYSRSYILLGWFGVLLMFIIIMLITFFYIIILPKKSEYYVTGIGILCTFMFFNTFTNMIYFSGISFQLVYPLLFSFINIRPKLKIKI